MNSALKLVAVVGLSFIFCGQLTASAFAGPLVLPPTNALQGKTKKKGERVEGTVTAINTSANTITIHNRKSDTDMVATISSDTKYMLAKNIGLTGLNVGDKISAEGKGDLVAGSTSVNANRINVLSPLSEPKKHESTRSVQGTITALTPVLTISTDDGSSMTVVADATTRVMAMQTASLADVAVGQHVQAVGKLKNGVYVASEIHVMPARAGKKGRRNAAATI
jgi:hypothetical protein